MLLSHILDFGYLMQVHPKLLHENIFKIEMMLINIFVVKFYIMYPCSRDSGNDFSFPFPFPKLNNNDEKSFLFGYPNYNSYFFSFPFLS